MAKQIAQMSCSLFSVAGRYASALLDLTRETGVTNQVAKDFACFLSLLESSQDLQRLIKDPTFSSKVQISALNKILDQCGIKGLAAQFVGLVAANGRLAFLPEMLRNFEYFAKIANGVTFADVVFAQSPSEKQIRDVTNIFQNVMGKDVSLNTSTNPDLIGGLVVQVGSRVVDGSIRSKLNSIRQAMKEIH